MPAEYYQPPEQATAAQVARAILRAKPDLAAKLQELVTPEVAWALAVLIVSWRPTDQPVVEISKYGDVTKQFDRFADTLVRLREAASKAKNDLDLAAATGFFLSLANQIGAFGLGYVLGSSRFSQIKNEILSRVPLSGELAANDLAADRSGFRSRRYLGFDFRPRGNVPSTAPSLAASADDIGRWQAELKRQDLTPEMRWLYEQKLVAAKNHGYTSADEARKAWQRAIASANSPEIRDYFAENLKDLEKPA